MDNTPHYIVPDTLVAENVFLSIGGKDILTGGTIRSEKGYITGILGRNGAGKSTMLQSVFGTRTAQECDVFLNGIKIKQPYSINDLVNYLPQRPFLPHGLALNKIAAQFRVNMDEICDYFPELEAAANKKATELSGGTERLFSVLILLLAETRFTFLDEPFTHIMPLHVEQLKTILLKQKEKKGIIITDHLYRHLLDVSSKIYLIKEGKSIFIKDRNDLVLHGYINEYPG